MCIHSQTISIQNIPIRRVQGMPLCPPSQEKQSRFLDAIPASQQAQCTSDDALTTKQSAVAKPHLGRFYTKSYIQVFSSGGHCGCAESSSMLGSIDPVI